MAAKKGGKAAKKTGKKRRGNSGALTHAQISKVSHEKMVRQIESLTFWVKMLKKKLNWGSFSRQDALDAKGRPAGSADPPKFP